MNTIPYFPQERPESCVPACLRMVLAAYGIERSEDDLYTCCETDVDGTLPSAVVRCVQQVGFFASAKRLSGLEELQSILTNPSILSIAFVNLVPLLGVPAIHAVVIESLSFSKEQNLTILDPAYPPVGRRRWSIDLFEIGWRLARNQVILISPTILPV